MSHLRVSEGGASSWSLVLVLRPTSSYVISPPKMGGQNGGQRPPKEHNPPPKRESLAADPRSRLASVGRTISSGERITTLHRKLAAMRRGRVHALNHGNARTHFNFKFVSSLRFKVVQFRPVFRSATQIVALSGREPPPEDCPPNTGDGRTKFCAAEEGIGA